MRYRVIYEKKEQLRFTSVLDIQAIWEQSIRRAGLSLEYSSGFHPQPKIQIGLPLPLGYTSSHEILDFWTICDTSADNILIPIQKSVPVGILIKSIEEVNNDQKSIVNQIKSCDYTISVYLNKKYYSDLNEKIEAILLLDEIIRSRRNKKYDLRPLIIKLSIENTQPIRIFMCLTSQPGRTGRPDEVALELGLELTEFTVERTAVLLDI